MAQTLEKTQVLELLDVYKYINLPYCYKQGRKLYQTESLLRDVATFMESPENIHFFNKYMSNPERFKNVMLYLKMYQLITQYLDRNNDTLNGYHKIFILYYLFHHPVYGSIFKKYLSSSNSSFKMISS